MPDVSLQVDLQDLEDVKAVGVAAVRFGLKLSSADNGEGRIDVNPQLSESTSSVTLAGAQIAVGRFVADWWKRRQQDLRGGLVFDLRSPQAVLSRDPQVPYGIVVNDVSDGTVAFQINSIMKDSAERLLGKISAAAGANSADIESYGQTAGATKLEEQPQEN